MSDCLCIRAYRRKKKMLKENVIKSIEYLLIFYFGSIRFITDVPSTFYGAMYQLYNGVWLHSNIAIFMF